VPPCLGALYYDRCGASLQCYVDLRQELHQADERGACVADFCCERTRVANERNTQDGECRNAFVCISGARARAQVMNPTPNLPAFT
jgi:hypothetical protein